MLRSNTNKKNLGINCKVDETSGPEVVDVAQSFS